MNALLVFNFETALSTHGGNAPLIRTLLNDFQVCLREEWKGLDERLDSLGWDAQCQQAHRLKSASGFLGAEQIACAARVLEDAILQNQNTLAREQACHALKEAIEAFLNFRFEAVF